MPSAAPRRGGMRPSSVDDHACSRAFAELLLHEKVIGLDSVLHGGPNLSTELLYLAAPAIPTRAMRVLDIGCGFGSFGFLAASRHPNISVHVCDSNESVIEEARFRLVEKYPHLLDQVFFECADLEEMSFSPSSFDAIVCFELNSFNVIDKKDLIASKFYDWLKPGGMLVMVDYCWSRAIIDRIPNAMSMLLSADDYRACLKSCSFPQLRVEDRTVLQRDLVRQDFLRLEKMRLSSKTEDSVRRDCLDQWKNLERMLSEDSLKWYLFSAKKSTAS